MGFLKDFKDFALKGNVLDLAIGIIIGTAFTKIVSSLVDDIITPAILTPALKRANLQNLQQLVVPGTGIKYGNFLSNVISFLIVALSLFLVIKAINATRRKKGVVVESLPPTVSEQLLADIRDELRSRPGI